MDDFIDDGEDEEDYSKHIRDIFKYDKSKYRDEYEDEPMESSFAQMQKEEALSKKLGECWLKLSTSEVLILAGFSQAWRKI